VELVEIPELGGVAELAAVEVELVESYSTGGAASQGANVAPGGLRKLFVVPGNRIS
jgi:hypothetical protein